MSSKQNRIERLFPAMTAEERVAAMLQAFWADEEPDPAIASTMPFDQFDRRAELLGLARSLNVQLGSYLLILRLEAERLQERWAAYLVLRYAQGVISLLAAQVAFDSSEPITQTGYAARLEAARAEALPLREAAELLALLRSDDADPTKKAIQSAERELRAAGRAGTLELTKVGRDLTVSSGAVHDLCGEAVMVLPDWGMAFDIRPDDEAAGVAARQARREQTRQATLRASTVLGQFEGGDTGIAGDLLHSLQNGISRSWMELRAAEIVLERVAREFRGVDPLDPASRGHLAVVRQVLTTLHEPLAERGHAVELEEPPADVVERLETLSRAIE